LREAERESRRREKQQIKLAQIQEKQAGLKQAAEAVQLYNDYMQRILSIHKTSSGNHTNWDEIAHRPSPHPPQPQTKTEDDARRALERFKPSFFHRVFGFAEREHRKLVDAIRRAPAVDRALFIDMKGRYEEELARWEEQTTLARRLLSADKSAMLRVIEERNPFATIFGLGEEINISFDEGGHLYAEVNVHSESVIPKEEFVTLKSGAFSKRKIPVSRYYEIYQDHVCGVTLRVARELFDLIPIQTCIVTAVDDLVNSTTGKTGKQPILSAFIPRETLSSLNFEQLDPSDAMSNFGHNMEFKKTQGFKPTRMVSFPKQADPVTD
jgi:hypothetical protein